MNIVRVTAPMGITLRAPVKLKLSPQQIDHRRHALREVEGGLHEPLKSGVNFVKDDEFGIEGPVTGPVTAHLLDIKSKKTLAQLHGDASAAASLDAARAEAKAKKTAKLL